MPGILDVLFGNDTGDVTRYRNPQFDFAHPTNNQPGVAPYVVPHGILDRIASPRTIQQANALNAQYLMQPVTALQQQQAIVNQQQANFDQATRFVTDILRQAGVPDNKIAETAGRYRNTALNGDFTTQMMNNDTTARTLAGLSQPITAALGQNAATWNAFNAADTARQLNLPAVSTFLTAQQTKRDIGQVGGEIARQQDTNAALAAEAANERRVAEQLKPATISNQLAEQQQLVPEQLKTQLGAQELAQLGQRLTGVPSILAQRIDLQHPGGFGGPNIITYGDNGSVTYTPNPAFTTANLAVMGKMMNGGLTPTTQTGAGKLPGGLNIPGLQMKASNQLVGPVLGGGEQPPVQQPTTGFRDAVTSNAQPTAGQQQTAEQFNSTNQGHREALKATAKYKYQHGIKISPEEMDAFTPDEWRAMIGLRPPVTNTQRPAPGGFVPVSK